MSYRQFVVAAAACFGGSVGLLRARRERPRRRAAHERDELAPLHSITSSARTSSVAGMFPSGNIVCEKSKFGENVPAWGFANVVDLRPSLAHVAAALLEPRGTIGSGWGLTPKGRWFDPNRLGRGPRLCFE